MRGRRHDRPRRRTPRAVPRSFSARPSCDGLARPLGLPPGRRCDLPRDQRRSRDAVPGEAVIAVAGAAASTGALDPAVLVPICWGAGVAGDTISWSLGRRYGAGVLPRLGPRIGIPAARVEAIADRVAMGGGWILVAGRFVGPVRVLAPFLTGASGMRYRTFLPYDTSGIALWAGTYLALGWAFSGALESATGAAGRIGVAVLLATTAVVVLGGRLSPRRAAVRR